MRQDNTQLFRDLGLDFETAVILDDELSTLPARTQRVFVMRAQGYTLEEIGDSEGLHKTSIMREVRTMYGLTRNICAKSVPYISRGK